MRTKQSTASGTNKSVFTSPVYPARNIHPFTRQIIMVQAGGRCQFEGCNKYLLEHPLTMTSGNFSQVAHIVAFSEIGPRGYGHPSSKKINDANNLMLLCPQCHKLIDDHPKEYSIFKLKEYKDKHEQRIRYVTGLGPDLKTTVIQLKTKVAGQMVTISSSQVTEAVAPRYPVDSRGFIIDLTDIEDKGSFTKAATEKIKRDVNRIYDRSMDLSEIHHISLFALAPIPILMFLGRQLSNKVPVEVFQRHRDAENWVWKTSGESVEYEFQRVRTGNNLRNVALILSLSGKIHPNSLPPEINDSYSIYEITLASIQPNPTYLRLREDLIKFKKVYQESLRTIIKNHGILNKIHFFPAIPAPVAVLCGRELLPKVDPTLLVYDFDKGKKGFNLILEVN